MILFRKKCPQHRKDRSECEHYSSYAKTLEEDFNKRCGYCDDLNSYRIRSFAIDHFVPRHPSDFTHDIKPNYYYNLVYACNYCNSSKSNKFPTKDPLKPNNGKEGFIFPTTKNYEDIFRRDNDGTIMSRNNDQLSNYIIAELNLKNPIHSLMWRFEKIISLEREVNIKLKLQYSQVLKDLHYSLMQEVMEIMNLIFENNE